MASFGVETPLFVDIADREIPKFKKYPYKSMEDDSQGAFLTISYGVLHVEDIRAYIHCNFEELGNAEMLKLYTNHIVDGMVDLKP